MQKLNIAIPPWANWLAQTIDGPITAHEYYPILSQPDDEYTCSDMAGRETILIDGPVLYHNNLTSNINRVERAQRQQWQSQKHSKQHWK